jgi:predicted CopG family antitoxin
MNTLELLHEIEKLKAKRDMFSDLINGYTEQLEALMTEEDEECIETATAVAFWRKETKVEVADWAWLQKYVREEDAFDILQKRISPAALKRRVDAGAELQGVTIREGKSFIVGSKKHEKPES